MESERAMLRCSGVVSVSLHKAHGMRDVAQRWRTGFAFRFTGCWNHVARVESVTGMSRALRDGCMIVEMLSSGGNGKERAGRGVGKYNGRTNDGRHIPYNEACLSLYLARLSIRMTVRSAIWRAKQNASTREGPIWTRIIL